MEKLVLQNNTTTLVDQVEGRLLTYFKENDLRVGAGSGAVDWMFSP